MFGKKTLEVISSDFLKTVSLIKNLRFDPSEGFLNHAVSVEKNAGLTLTTQFTSLQYNSKFQ